MSYLTTSLPNQHLNPRLANGTWFINFAGRTVSTGRKSLNSLDKEELLLLIEQLAVVARDQCEGYFHSGQEAKKRELREALGV